MSAQDTSDPHPLLYLDTAAGVERFLADIAATRELALDTEGASFHRFVDRIYLLQLSTRDRSAIVDPLAVRPPEALGRILEDPAVEVVFHDADYDLRLLHQDYGWHVRHIFDTRIAAQLLGMKAFGLSALLEQYFGVKLDKRHQRADWSMRPLSAEMLAYAAQDTRYLLDLRDRLRDALDRRGRLAWATEEFALLEGTRWDSGADEDAFLRIKGARDLDRRGLAVLRELVTWRDAVARSLDRSTFRVAGNEVLLTLAAERPRSRSALSAVRGLGRGLVEQRAGEILAAIQRGLDLAEADLPRFPRPPRYAKDPEFDARVLRLRAARDAAAARLELDPGVLMPRERLEAIARTNPATAEQLSTIPGVRGWQVRELGQELIGALAG